MNTLTFGYDVAIVGGGSAGCILAARLTEDASRNVVLIEAGPDYPILDQLPDELKVGFHVDNDTSSHLWRWRANVGCRAEPAVVLGGRVVGGGSAVNGQVFVRGLPEDFDGWATLGNSAWTFDKILPYFIDLEKDFDCDNQFHGRSGRFPVKRFLSGEYQWRPSQHAFYSATQALGFRACDDLNHPQGQGVASTPFNNFGGMRISASIAYLDEARARANLTIWPHTEALGIEVDRDRAAGVWVTDGAVKALIRAETVVISAGAIGSPHLLLRSGVGPAAHLGSIGVPVVANVSGVGSRLRDHPHVRVGWQSDVELVADATLPRNHLRLRYTSSSSAEPNDMVIIMSGEPASDAEQAHFETWPMIMFPTGHGTVRLQSAALGDPPVIDLNYLADDHDRNRIREAVKTCIEIVESPDFRRLRPMRTTPADEDLSSDRALDAWISQHISSGYHLTSTCPMGPASDPDAVVDEDGRVHAVENLWVADASIMPTSLRANVNVTTMAIAERIATVIGA